MADVNDHVVLGKPMGLPRDAERYDGRRPSPAITQLLRSLVSLHRITTQHSITPRPVSSFMHCLPIACCRKRSQMSTRRPTHAGSWYEDDTTRLKAELDGWLEAVPSEIGQLGTLPVPDARIIIGPFVLSLPTFDVASLALDIDLEADEQ
jgi:hypothetical protein